MRARFLFLLAVLLLSFGARAEIACTAGQMAACQDMLGDLQASDPGYFANALCNFQDPGSNNLRVCRAPPHVDCIWGGWNCSVQCDSPKIVVAGVCQCPDGQLVDPVTGDCVPNCVPDELVQHGDGAGEVTIHVSGLGATEYDLCSEGCGVELIATWSGGSWQGKKTGESCTTDTHEPATTYIEQEASQAEAEASAAAQQAAQAGAAAMATLLDALNEAVTAAQEAAAAAQSAAVGNPAAEALASQASDAADQAAQSAGAADAVGVASAVETAGDLAMQVGSMTADGQALLDGSHAVYASGALDMIDGFVNDALAYAQQADAAAAAAAAASAGAAASELVQDGLPQLHETRAQSQGAIQGASGAEGAAGGAEQAADGIGDGGPPDGGGGGEGDGDGDGEEDDDQWTPPGDGEFGDLPEQRGIEDAVADFSSRIQGSPIGQAFASLTFAEAGGACNLAPMDAGMFGVFPMTDLCTIYASELAPLISVAAWFFWVVLAIRVFMQG